MTTFSAETGFNFRPGRFYDASNATRRVAVAVSACLAGEKVRYDGIDKLLPVYPLLRDALTLVSICPETGAGLGVPRPPVQLIERGGQVRAQGRENAALDVTSPLQIFAAHSLRQLLSEHLLCGYVWKSRSPSCGFGSTPLLSADGVEMKRGSGIQADYFQRHLPYLSYSEETALETAASAASFVLRCRLVFDLLYVPDTPLQILHRHYTFLHENFDQRVVKNLDASNAGNSKANYLVAFLVGCNQMPQDNLLELFN